MNWDNDISYRKVEAVDIDRCGQMVCMLVHHDTPARLNGEYVLILGPSLVCLNGHESISIQHGELEIIQFTIQFLCRSASEEMMRQENFWELASRHNLFYLSPFLNKDDYENGIIYLNPHLYRFLRFQFSNAQKACEDKNNGRWSCNTRSYLTEILVPFEKQKLEGLDPFLLKKDGIPYQLVEYVRSHYNEPINANELAKMFKENRSTVFTLFKGETGYALTDYIARYRMFIAKHILAFTEVPVAEIAERVGYLEPSYFSRVFKKHLGCTPEDFRRQALAARKAELNKKQPSPGTAIPEDGCTPSTHKG